MVNRRFALRSAVGQNGAVAAVRRLMMFKKQDEFWAPLASCQWEASSEYPLPHWQDASGTPLEMRIRSMKSFAALRLSRLLSDAMLAVVAFLTLGDIASARTINWAGYDWWVRTSNGNPQGPGPNIFSDSTQNVFVDAQGNLHLKIRKGADGKWTSSEVDLNQSLSYGTYEWELSSRYDQFASNAVGGLFTYLSPEAVAAQTGGVVGNGVADTPHEIDIEFTGAWGSGNLFYTTHDGDVPAPSVNYKQTLAGDYTTHRFTWSPGRIEWESFNGHVAGVADPPNPIVEQRPGAQNGQPAHRVYTGAVVPQDLTEVPIINFWLFGDNPSADGPADGAEQEMIIKSFKYTPLPSADFDGDGAVDGDDFLTWQRGAGLSSGVTHASGDANRDGAINAADLAMWSAQFAGQSVAAAATQVPECSSASLSAIGLLLAARLFF
jgi:hypothetical protein